MKTLEEIKEILNNNKEILREKYKVKEIGIFGSYVRREQRKKSDVDILVEFEEPVSLLKLVSVENFLKEIVGAKVEVIPKKDIRSELKEKILKEVVYI
mgnify:CR=1 FL=1